MNSVSLIGRLVDDPIINQGTDKYGKPYTRAYFTLAVNRNASASEADFIRVTCFGRVAEATAKYQHKGNQVGVNGSIRTGKYTDKDGRTIHTVDVNAITVDFLAAPKGQSNDRDGGVERNDGGWDESQAFSPFDEDIMF